MTLQIDQNEYNFIIESLMENNPSQLQQESLSSILVLIKSDKNQFKNHLNNILLQLPKFIIQINFELNVISTQIFQELLINFPEDSVQIIQQSLNLIIQNLGEIKATLRKASHNCLMQYIRTTQSFEHIIKAFISQSFQNQNNWILKQKGINSFQSLILCEGKYFDFNSNDSKIVLELFINKVFNPEDENPNVIKATEQTLISFCKMEKFYILAKNIDNINLQNLKQFIEQQKITGILQGECCKELFHPAIIQNQNTSNNNNNNLALKHNSKEHTTTNLLTNVGLNITNNNQLLQQQQQQNQQQQGGQQQLLTNNNSNNNSAKKVSSVSQNSSNSQNSDKKDYQHSNLTVQPAQQLINNQNQKQNKSGSVEYFGFMSPKIFQDLNDEKDWRARASAIEECLNQIENLSSLSVLDMNLFEFLNLLLKLNNDQNFKITLVSLKILNIIIVMIQFKEKQFYEVLIPKMIEKLGDSKIAIRQASSKIIREHFRFHKTPLWIEKSLQYLQDRNQHLREEVLNLITHLYQEENYIAYNWEVVLSSITPLIEDNKTKIKIKSLDCLVAVTLKNNQVQCLGHLSQKLNQVYYDMFVDKLQQVTMNKINSNNNKIEMFSPYTQSSSITQYGNQQHSQSPNLNTDQSFRSVQLNQDQNKQHMNYKNNNKNKEDFVFLNVDDSRFSAQTANTMNTSSNTIVQSQQRNLFDTSLIDSSSNSTSRPPIAGEQNNLQEIHNIQDQTVLNQSQSNKIEKNSEYPTSGNNFNNNIQNDQIDMNFRAKSAQIPVEVQQNNQIPIDRSASAFSANYNERNFQGSNQESISQLPNFKINNPLDKFQCLNDYSDYQLSRKDSQGDEQITHNNYQSQNNFAEGKSQKVVIVSDMHLYTQSSTINEEIADSKIINNVQQQQYYNNEKPPNLNLYKGANLDQQYSLSNISYNSNITGTSQEQIEEPKTYQYKPPLQKKKQQFKKINDQAVENNLNSNITPNNAQQQLIIQSKEYQDKNTSNSKFNNNNINNNNGQEDENKFATKPFLPKKNNNQQIQNQNEEDGLKEYEQMEDKYSKINPKPFIKKKIAQNNQNKNQNQQQQSQQQSTSQQNQEGNQLKSTLLETKNFNYINKMDLLPLSCPEQALRAAFNDLKLDDWQKQFDSLSIIRRLVQHHQDVVVGFVHFHNFIMEILKQVESLRSGLAKNAMITLQELCNQLKKQIDSELDQIISKLLKKSLETNSFITKEVRDCLNSICQNCTESKVTQILIGHTNNRSVQFKFNLALCFEYIVEKHGNKILQIKDSEKLLQVISNYTQDSAAEVRNVAKRAFNTILRNVINRQELENILKRQLPDQIFLKMQQIIEKTGQVNFIITNNSQNQGGGGLNSSVCNNNNNSIPPTNINNNNNNANTQNLSVQSSTNMNVSNTSSTVSSKQKGQQKKDKKAFNFTQKDEQKSSQQNQDENSQEEEQSPVPEKQQNSLNETKNIKQKTTYNLKNQQGFKLTKDPIEFETLPILFQNCENNDWRHRFEAINSLSELARKYPDHLSQHKLANKFIDFFMKLINDSNIKVSVCALNSFSELIEKINLAIETNITTVMNAIFQTFAATNPQVKTYGENLFSNMVQTFDCSILFPHLCQGSIYATQKARSVIINKIIDCCDDTYQSKPPLFLKNILNTISKLLDDNKPEIKNSTQQLVKKTYSLIQNQIFDGPNQKKQQQIQDILGIK